MGNQGFHEKPYDAGTLAKLRIFELYAREWIPVFVSPENPPFKDIHIFDFFCGPGTDSNGIQGSPLLILNQLREYHKRHLAGWDKVRMALHLFDHNETKIEQLKSTLDSGDLRVSGVAIDCRALPFSEALNEHQRVMASSRSAKLLIIDQFGVDEISDEVFRRLIAYPTTDFIFFISSSTLHRFRDHPAIKQKIDRPQDSFDVHRAVVNHYRKLVPKENQLFLGSFSIRKRSNIYGLIFGSHHPLGIHKFLEVAWNTDEIAGEANFDIEQENMKHGEGILPLDVMRPKKIQEFEERLEEVLRAGLMKSEADVMRFCVEAGMTCRHSAEVLKKLKGEGTIGIDFRVPDVRNLKSPRPILVHKN